VYSKLVLFAQFTSFTAGEEGATKSLPIFEIILRPAGVCNSFLYFRDVQCRTNVPVSITWQSWQAETNSFGFVPSKRQHKETNNKSEPNISRSTVPNPTFRQILCGLAVDSDV
jgi:hypothetical protein